MEWSLLTDLKFCAESPYNQPISYKIFQQLSSKYDNIDAGGKPSEKDHLCRLIQFHLTSKEWFLESSEVYSPFILIQLICSMIYMACSVFQLDLHLKHFDIGIIILLIGITLSSSNLFLYCFFGRLATESLAKMVDCLYESKWILIPIDLKKYLILAIANMQKPLYYHGFGIAILNLETFSKFMRRVYTFYMTFKTITSQ